MNAASATRTGRVRFAMLDAVLAAAVLAAALFVTVALVVGVALGPSLAPASATPSGSVAGPQLWVQQPTPPTGQPDAVLSDIDCISATHCVAVGGSGPTSSEFVLAEAWDGTDWSIQTPATLRPDIRASLTSVSCVGEDFCMAVGAAQRTATYQTFVELWNGTEWTVIPSPNAGSGNNLLAHVDCATTTFCVAVGYAGGARENEGLVLMWDGSVWTQVTTPALSVEGSLFAGVSCPSAVDCRMVGYTYTGENAPVVEHWDGSAWSVETIPNPGSNPGLLSIDCVDSSNCMAVGLRRSGAGQVGFSMRLHDGVWDPVPDLSFGHGMSNFASVSCVDATHCVGVGRATDLGPLSLAVDPTISGGSDPVHAAATQYPPAIALFDGGAWTVEPDPAGGFTSMDIGLYGVSCPTAIRCLTVGSSYTAGGFTPIVFASVQPPAPPSPPVPPAFTG